MSLYRSETLQAATATPNPFYFYTDVGVYADKLAADLQSFYKILAEVDIRSIKFHMNRDDFEKWIKALGEYTLARDITKIKKKALKGEARA